MSLMLLQSFGHVEKSSTWTDPSSKFPTKFVQFPASNSSFLSPSTTKNSSEEVMEETYSGITTNINNELHSKPKPRIDYTLKAIGGSLTAIPGISDMIDDTVNSIVTHMLQWPHRIVVQLGGIPIDTSELELKSQGKLALTVVKAAALKNMEMIGKSDPYVVVHIRPLFKYKTKVLDKDIGQDKRLGIAQLPLIGLEIQTEKEIELRLLPSLDTLKLVALEAEKKILEERKKLKEAGVIGCTMDVLDGAVSVVGSGVGLVW
ncbi:Synaptotagmin-4 isoform B [Glycine soja]|uniref:Synaptotagmin-4 isoform B n=1 Tax=Glycine soja TaxID=3848 RepID=A0A445L194_GLYSO|nr:Synaptotagmin-4 isoform B [Glycine soja]